MEYQKPAVLIEPALKAVKGSQTKDSDKPDTESISSVAAYEADE